MIGWNLVDDFESCKADEPHVLPLPRTIKSINHVYWDYYDQFLSFNAKTLFNVFADRRVKAWKLGFRLLSSEI